MTLAILFIPPIMTKPTKIAKNKPKIGPKLDMAGKTVLKAAKAWFAWNILPPPIEPPTHKIAKRIAKNFA